MLKLLWSYLPKMLLWGLVYRYKCCGYNATCYGKTKRHFKVPICEHLGISHLTEKKVKIDKNKLTAIQEHLLSCNYSPSYDMFYHIIWCPSIPLCVYNCRLFSFHYYVTSFVFYQKTECKSIYYHFRCEYESSSFRQLVRNKWICRETCDFLWSTFHLS